MILIGLSGHAQVGKDTVGQYLVQNHGFLRLAFADELKKIAGKYLGWDGQKDYRGRRLLQELGVTMRHYNHKYWVTPVLETIRHYLLCEHCAKFVITDVRFNNEAEEILEHGGRLWRIERTVVYPYSQVPEHESETELDSFSGFDVVIQNNGTFEELYRKVDDAYAKIS